MARPYSTENDLNPGTAGGTRSPELAGAEVPLAKFLASGGGYGYQMPARALFHTEPRCVEVKDAPAPRTATFHPNAFGGYSSPC